MPTEDHKLSDERLEIHESLGDLLAKWDEGMSALLEDGQTVGVVAVLDEQFLRSPRVRGRRCWLGVCCRSLRSQRVRGRRNDQPDRVLVPPSIPASAGQTSPKYLRETRNRKSGDSSILGNR